MSDANLWIETRLVIIVCLSKVKEQFSSNRELFFYINFARNLVDNTNILKEIIKTKIFCEYRQVFSARQSYQ